MHAVRRRRAAYSSTIFRPLDVKGTLSADQMEILFSFPLLFQAVALIGLSAPYQDF